MKNNTIVLSNEPRGRFLEGIVAGTPSPGHLGQIKAAVEPVSGRHTWELAAPGADGADLLVAVWREDEMQGKMYSSAYVAGTRGFLYVPISGEELNVRVGEVAGTGNTYAIGDKLMANTSGGYLIPHTGGAANRALFVVMETITQQSGQSLVHVMRL